VNFYDKPGAAFILRLVAAKAGLSETELCYSKDANLVLVHARHQAMWLMRTHRPWMSYAQIGAVFDRNHSTVLYAVRKVEAARKRRLEEIRRAEAVASMPAPFNFYQFPGWLSIVRLVALKYGVTVDEILGPRRSHPISAARHEAVRLVCSHCEHTPSHVAWLFDLDHTSVRYVLRKSGQGARLAA
jgi:chromosomal replication initiation ATPase DnaA